MGHLSFLFSPFFHKHRSTLGSRDDSRTRQRVSLAVELLACVAGARRGRGIGQGTPPPPLLTFRARFSRFMPIPLPFPLLAPATQAIELPKRAAKKYRRIPMISPGLIFVQKVFWLIFGRAYFLRCLLWEGILCFKMGWA